MKKYEVPYIEIDNIIVEETLAASGIKLNNSNIDFNLPDEIL